MNEENTTLLISKEISAQMDKIVEVEMKKDLRRFVDKKDMIRYLVKKLILDERIEIEPK